MNIVLLSGGSGKRLWPLSNDVRSKQFIKIFKGENGEYESMVQRIYRQIRALDKEAQITIATSKTQVSAIHNQLGEKVGISVEPCRRDTFPAIVLAAAYLADVQKVPLKEAVVVCPVDPYVEQDYFEALKDLGRQKRVRQILCLWGLSRPIRVKNTDIFYLRIKKVSAAFPVLKKSRICRRQSSILRRERSGMEACLRFSLDIFLEKRMS